MPWKSSSSSMAAKPKPILRSKSTAKSIRGQISAPIPVADSYAEFSEPMQLHPSRDGAQQLDGNSNPRQEQDFDQSQISKAAEDSAVLSQVQSGPQRVTIDNSAAPNPVHEASKRLSKSQTKDAPARKRSPIRDVISRLFGRRRKTASQLTTASEPAQRSSAPPQHMVTTTSPQPTRVSAPILTGSKGKIEKANQARGSGASRSASLPVTEFDRALRSHSVGLDDVIAIRSARNSVAMDQIQPKKRIGESATPYALGARYIGDGKLAGLCPRPASVNDRDLRSSAIMTDDPDEIGRAITSDASGLRRRSRSMSAMSLMEANQEVRRRRSQELRELRESCFYDEDPLSPLSSEFPEEDALATFDLDLPNPPRPATPEPTTPGPYLFGNLISEEEAANRQQVGEITLSSRVNGIENRLHVLEDSVSLLRYKSNPYANVGWKPSDATIPSGLGIQPSFSYPNTRDPHYSLSMGMAPTSTRPSTGHSEAVFTESITSHSGGGGGDGNRTDSRAVSQQPSFFDSARPTSGQTVRGSNGQLLAPRHTPSLSEEQFTAILGLLETERSARLVLEAQVQQLTRQVRALLGKHARQHAAPAAVSVFEYDADESESPRSSSARYNVWHPLKGYPVDDSGIDPGVSYHAAKGSGFDDDEDDDTESASQLYATPREETHAADFGAYPGGTDQQQQEDGSATRTLSLSRMTMAPMPTAVM
ncbi:hypothetical protein CCM_02325 [Cordyceps militaris CM01]|uniref:Uncharacterized protein n=1 Tax=Cordyceps militaris (strain CM01) TaxID=983644 RepID=G3J922_CORMM|nr:uncharacterized protein CCM_02325 [Cordyceps militaris CM01]EGX94054.1 hypothetical protein CCM_02325 [Cordyceps militaris CM01]